MSAGADFDCAHIFERRATRCPVRVLRETILAEAVVTRQSVQELRGCTKRELKPLWLRRVINHRPQIPRIQNEAKGKHGSPPTFGRRRTMADSLRPVRTNTISGHACLAGVPAVAPASAGRRSEEKMKPKVNMEVRRRSDDAELWRTAFAR
jgi:hypothetical protein